MVDGVAPTKQELKMVVKKVNLSITEKSNKNNESGEFVMLKTNRNLKKSGRSFFMSKVFGHLNRDLFNVKKVLYVLVVLGFLATMISCACSNPAAPSDPDPDPNTNTLVMSNVKGENIFFFPENTVTLTRSVFFVISNFIMGNNSDITITSSPGADVAMVNTNNLNIDLTAGVISGSLKLNQRLDFENPRDAGNDPTNNIYEIVNFNVTADTGGFNTNFKFLVQITDERIEPIKIEILVDAYHLATNNAIRGINEFYLYEDANAPDPITGNDTNNFLSADLVTNHTVIGDVDSSSSIANLYDGDDATSGFLTATPINSSSRTYHRLTLYFNEKVNIKKLAIRGRQIGGYQGFIFIMRDENDSILYVQRANGTTARASGTDADALSTYSLVPSPFINSRYPISDFDIRINNLDFDIGENTTNVILVDNFSVISGYEYERGFVSFTGTGADFDKFDLDNAYFLYNDLNGIIFNMPPNAEAPTDADSNNIYEVGMVTITNVDGGHTNFNLSVTVVNMPSTVSLSSNAVSYTMSIYTSNIIEDLAEVVNVSNFENGLSLGQGTYTYELTGADSNHFKVVGNTLKTVGDFGFSNSYINEGLYDLEVRYVPEDPGTPATLTVTVEVFGGGVLWSNVSASAPWGGRTLFQAVTLTNDDILVMGGIDGSGNLLNDVWSSSDRGVTWNQITASAPWRPRHSFQAVTFKDNGLNVVVVINGHDGNNKTDTIWISINGGTNWVQWNDAPWHAISSFQAVSLANNGILIMGGNNDRSDFSPVNHVWRTYKANQHWHVGRIGNTNTYWTERAGFQAVALTNNEVLILGGLAIKYHFSFNNYVVMTNDVWLLDNERDWTYGWRRIPAENHWVGRCEHQAIVLANNDVLVMGGYDGVSSYLNDVWLSSDEGASWSNITPINNGHWSPRKNHQAVVFSDKSKSSGVLGLVMGGDARGYPAAHSDVWQLLRDGNTNY